jgi:hypothetical protein
MRHPRLFVNEGPPVSAPIQEWAPAQTYVGRFYELLETGQDTAILLVSKISEIVAEIGRRPAGQVYLVRHWECHGGMPRLVCERLYWRRADGRIRRAPKKPPAG